MKMAGSQAYGTTFPMLEMVLPSTHYSSLQYASFFFFDLLNLVFKVYCYYSFPNK